MLSSSLAICWSQEFEKLTWWGCVCRPMPLTATGGANAVNSQDENSAEKGSPGDGATPAVKKPKGVEKNKAQQAKKKALRRL